MNAPIAKEVLESTGNLVEVVVAQPKAYATSNIVEEANAMIVDSAFMFEECGEQLKLLTTMDREIEEQRKELVKPINESKEKIQAFFKKHSDPVQKAIAILKGKYSAYAQEQKRIADEEQRKANAEAEAERARLAAQAVKATQEAAAIIEDQQTTGIVTEEQAVKLVEVENKALELQTQAAMTVAPVLRSAPAKVAGISSRENWKFEVIDLSLVPREYLMIDEKKVSGVVKAMKAETKIAGIRAYPEAVLATRTK